MRTRNSRKHSYLENYRALDIVIQRLNFIGDCPEEIVAVEKVMNDLWWDMSDKDRQTLLQALVAVEAECPKKS